MARLTSLNSMNRPDSSGGPTIAISIRLRRLYVMVSM